MQTKPCPRCQTNVGIEFFPKNKAKPDGHGAICLKCHREYTRSHYKKNKDQYAIKQRKRQADAKAFLRNLKETVPCKDCGKTFPGEPWVMEFDHISEKRFNIGSSHGWGVKAVSEEARKCDLVCVLCHRRRTAKRAGWI